MRKALIAVGLILLGLAGPAQSDIPSWQAHHLGAADCRKNLGERNEYICKHPELLAQDGELARQYEELRKSFTGDDRRIFMTEQWSWINHFSCFDYRDPRHYNKDYMRCLQDTMRERLGTLKALKADPSLLRKQATDYDYVDPWYLGKFARQYAGKTVNVEAFVEIADCEGPLSPVPARLEWDGSRVAAEFKSLKADQMQFYCEKGIGTWWGGVVGIDPQGRAVLHMTEPGYSH